MTNKSQAALLDEISSKLDTVIAFLATRNENDPVRSQRNSQEWGSARRQSLP